MSYVKIEYEDTTFWIIDKVFADEHQYLAAALSAGKGPFVRKLTEMADYATRQGAIFKSRTDCKTLIDSFLKQSN